MYSQQAAAPAGLEPKIAYLVFILDGEGGDGTGGSYGQRGDDSAQHNDCAQVAHLARSSIS